MRRAPLRRTAQRIRTARIPSTWGVPFCLVDAPVRRACGRSDAADAARAAPGQGSSLPGLHRCGAHRSHIRTGTGLTPATSAPGLGPSRTSNRTKRNKRATWMRGSDRAALQRVWVGTCLPCTVSGLHRVWVATCLGCNRVWVATAGAIRSGGYSVAPQVPTRERTARHGAA